MVEQQTKDILNASVEDIRADGLNIQNASEMFYMAKNIISKYNDIPYSLKVTKYLKDKMDDAMLKKTDIEELYQLRWEVLKFESPYLFESYLLYLERKRQQKDKFYEPKMKQLNKHGLIQAMQDLEDDKLDILSISMPPGTQKCQPLYSKVLTPNGFIKMRDVKAGTKVIAANGNISTVLTTSKIKKRPIYELTFDDGSKVRSSDNHLWTVQTRDDRRRKNKDGSEKYRTVELSSIIKNFRVENGKRANYSIDYVEKIEFEQKEKLEIDPYVLGVLIGDGSITDSNLSFTTADKEILERVKMNIPLQYELKKKGEYGYSIKTNTYYTQGKSELRKSLEKYKLKGLGAKEKHIPEEYLYSKYEDRIWLLRGLMDTDGYASAKSTNCSYATISERLAIDVKELVNSLGGYASIQKTKAGYKKEGIYIKCNDCYIVTIGFEKDGINPFYLKRKSDRYNPKRKKIKRYIENIEYIGEEDCKCIYIDDPSHLYITDNYIITHNTTLEKFFASWIIGRHPEDYSLFFSHSNDITNMFYEGVLDITTNESEYCWSEIFPDVKFQDKDAKRQMLNFDKYKSYYSLQCTSVGAKNAGKVRTNRYLYCDDLIAGIEEALNKNSLDKIWRIYGTDAKQRKLNEQVKEIHIATRWSVHDVIGRLQVLYEGNERARFIAVPDIDPETGESNFDYEYNGMTVKFFNDQELTMDEISYKCLYKNDPIEREGLLYSDEELRRYLELPQQEPDAILGICDTKNKGTDFYFLPCFYQYGEDFYLVDCICNDSADYGLQYKRSADIILNHKMQQCEFETNNGGDRVAFEVQKLVKERGGRCNITDKFTSSNKETKIIVNADWIKKHVLFKDKSMYTVKEDYGVMMTWLFRYSLVGKNPHDDVPDGLASFALFVTNGIKTVVKILTNPFTRRMS